MNYNLVDLADFEISSILKFLFGGTIELGRGKKQDALSYRLVCKKFKRAFDKLAHLSVYLPIRNSNCPLSEISSISMLGVIITKQDWEDVFGDKLSNVESSLEYLHVNASLVEYLPKFTCLKTISWGVTCGCYDLLKEIPHKELKITGYTTHRHVSIAHLTRLREIRITMSYCDNKLIDKYLPPTILRMTIDMYPDMAEIDLSKFKSLKYLKIVACYPLNKQIIKELILPTSLNEFYSEVRIKKMNLHECKKLEVIELKK